MPNFVFENFWDHCFSIVFFIENQYKNSQKKSRNFRDFFDFFLKFLGSFFLPEKFSLKINITIFKKKSKKSRKNRDFFDFFKWYIDFQ